MRYFEHPPSARLRRFVRCYWFLSGPDAVTEAAADPALPDGSPELIFNLADPFQAVRVGHPRRLQPTIMLVGQITGPFSVAPTGRIDIVGARLEPFGAAGLWEPMAQLTGGWADGDDIPHAQLAEARAALRLAPGAEDRASILDHHLGSVFAAAKPPDWRVESAVTAIRASHGAVALDQLATDLGTTPRSLQRLFAAQVGITPKMLARITRFQRVFSAWRRDSGSLAGVAAKCGYFDQSHLIRDFRDFAGEAPAALRASVTEFTAFFIAPERAARETIRNQSRRPSGGPRAGQPAAPAASRHTPRPGSRRP